MGRHDGGRRALGRHDGGTVRRQGGRHSGDGARAGQRNSGTARQRHSKEAGRRDGRTAGRRDDGTTGRRRVPGRGDAVRDAKDLTRIARTEDRLQRNRPRRQSKFRARRLSQRWPQRRPAKGSAIGLEPDLHQAGHRHKDAYRDGRSARQRRMVGRQGHRTGQAVRQTAVPARRSDLASPPPADQPLDQPPTRARSPPQINATRALIPSQQQGPISAPTHRRASHRLTNGGCIWRLRDGLIKHPPRRSMTTRTASTW
jgi:hypothetical protein